MSSEMTISESETQKPKPVGLYVPEMVHPRRNTVGAIVPPKHLKAAAGDASLSESLKKMWKGWFSGKEQQKKQDAEQTSNGTTTPEGSPSSYKTDKLKKDNDLKQCSPRTLARRMKLIQRKGSSVTEEDILHFAVSREDSKGVKRVLEHGKVDLNFMRPPGVSALHQACALGNLQCIELLLEYGADPNQRTWKGLSPIQIAARYGYFEAAELLLKEGADMDDIKDGLG